jgi:hypothetical protein
MALIKSIENEMGVSPVYWNIGAVQEDFKGQGTEVTVYGYMTKQHRLNGSQPVSAMKIQFAGQDYVPGADRATLYGFLKQKDQFAGSTDD